VHLTELENAVLGVVWLRGPCSAYLIKREFDTAPSVSWSASAGSIYPLVRKLAASGLLVMTKAPWGKGTKTLVELSGTGRQALVDWTASVPEWAGLVAPDPIRTRVFFLNVLSTIDDHLRFVEDSEQVTRTAIANLESELRELPAQASVFERLANEGALFQLKARLRWLRRLRGVLQGEPGSP
jgi:DNA-binding PadR family transcriptional regulator